MRRRLIRMCPLLYGGMTLGLLGGLGSINYNSILFRFMSTWITALVALLFGGSLPTDSTNP